MLVLTPKYSSLIDLDLLKNQKEQKKEPLIKHRNDIIYLTHCKTIKKAYLTFLDNKGKYFIGYKPKDAVIINRFVKSLGEIDTLDVSWIDVSDLVSLEYCFANCRARHIIGLLKWDVSKVDDMSSMFQNCLLLESIESMSEWDVSNVKRMGSMFQNCLLLESIESMSEWVVSDVKDMSCMFNSCHALKSIDISEWDVSKVDNMSGMFYGCKTLKSIDISEWDVSNVKSMGSMFSFCENIESIGDLSGWDVSNVKTMFGMYEMFNNCRKLLSVGDLEQWNVSDTIDVYDMFKDSAINPIPSWHKR